MSVSNNNTTNHNKPKEENFKTPTKPKIVPKRKSLIERWGTIPTEEERKSTVTENIQGKSVPACNDLKLPGSCKNQIELSSAKSSVDDRIIKYRPLKKRGYKNPAKNFNF